MNFADYGAANVFLSSDFFENYVLERAGLGKSGAGCLPEKGAGASRW